MDPDPGAGVGTPFNSRRICLGVCLRCERRMSPTGSPQVFPCDVSLGLAMRPRSCHHKRTARRIVHGCLEFRPGRLCPFRQGVRAVIRTGARDESAFAIDDAALAPPAPARLDLGVLSRCLRRRPPGDVRSLRYRQAASARCGFYRCPVRADAISVFRAERSPPRPVRRGRTAARLRAVASSGALRSQSAEENASFALCLSHRRRPRVPRCTG